MDCLTITDITLSEPDIQTLGSTADEPARFELSKQLFHTFFEAAPTTMACAGGRVNLIGEHVDYPDVQFAGDTPVHLFSMGGAIQNNYIVVGSPRTDGRISLVHLDCFQRLDVDLDALADLEERAVSDRENGRDKSERLLPSWAVHTLGAIKEMVDRGVATTGFNLLLTRNVPYGAGMSCSAANCVAVGLVLEAIYPNLDLSEPIDLVTFARLSENSRFAGGQCGWLDQLLIVNSKANMLTKIDYANNGIQHFESRLPEAMQFVAYNTNVPHVLAESDYGHRVRELTLGIQFMSDLLHKNAGGPNFRLASLNALIQAMDPSISSIELPDALSALVGNPDEAVCEFDTDAINRIVSAVDASFEVPDDLPMHRDKTAKESFAIILRRMRHQKMSSLLVPMAGEAAAQGNAELFGLLLDLEGHSLRMSGDFMITGDNGAQDTLLDCAFNAATDLGIRVHGRMLGGGGGGNVLLYADTSDRNRFEQWEESTIAAYNAWAQATYPDQGIEATVITPVISAGAQLIPLG